MQVQIDIKPIGRVRRGRSEDKTDFWGTSKATIELDTERFGPEALEGLDEFSHLEVVFFMDRVDPKNIVFGKRRPRERGDMPEKGIFAQRGRVRPNRIGVSRCKILKVSGTQVEVEGLDALEGSPVLDLKPWCVEMGPQGPVREPKWISEVLKEYNSPEP